MMQLRPYQPRTDAPLLAALYRESVLAIAPQRYSPQQVQAWAAYGQNDADLARRLESGITLVGVIDDQPVAFGQLWPMDYLAFLYCASDHCRRGYASRLYDVLESYAISAGSSFITTHASEFSRPVFERKGFRLVEIEHVIRSDVRFDRYVMRKDLTTQA